MKRAQLVLYCASVAAMGISGWRLVNLEQVKAGGGICCSSNQECWDTGSDSDNWVCASIPPCYGSPCSPSLPNQCFSSYFPPCVP